MGALHSEFCTERFELFRMCMTEEDGFVKAFIPHMLKIYILK